jgi:hypothetical protein
MSKPKDSLISRALRRLGRSPNSEPRTASDNKKAIIDSDSESDDGHDDDQRDVGKRIAHAAVEKQGIGIHHPTAATTVSDSKTAPAVPARPSTLPAPAPTRDESFNIDHFVLKNPDLPIPIAQQLALTRQSRPYDGSVMITGPLVKELTETAQNAWHTGFWPDGTPAKRERRWSGGEPGSGIGGGCG